MRIYESLKDEGHARAVKIIGGFVVATIAGSWVLYKHFYPREAAVPTEIAESSSAEIISRLELLEDRVSQLINAINNSNVDQNKQKSTADKLKEEANKLTEDAIGILPNDQRDAVEMRIDILLDQLDTLASSRYGRSHDDIAKEQDVIANPQSTFVRNNIYTEKCVKALIELTPKYKHKPDILSWDLGEDLNLVHKNPVVVVNDITLQVDKQHRWKISYRWKNNDFDTPAAKITVQFQGRLIRPDLLFPISGFANTDGEFMSASATTSAEWALVRHKIKSGYNTSQAIHICMQIAPVKIENQRALHPMSDLPSCQEYCGGRRSANMIDGYYPGSVTPKWTDIDLKCLEETQNAIGTDKYDCGPDIHYLVSTQVKCPEICSNCQNRFYSPNDNTRACAYSVPPPALVFPECVQECFTPQRTHTEKMDCVTRCSLSTR